jgi:hypothetical protein
MWCWSLCWWVILSSHDNSKPPLAFNTDQIKSLGVYLLISLIAVFIVISLNVAYVGVADSDDYVVYALALLEGRYKLAISLRTYGYPLFIIACTTLGKLLALPFPTALLIGRLVLCAGAALSSRMVCILFRLACAIFWPQDRPRESLRNM